MLSRSGPAAGPKYEPSRDGAVNTERFNGSSPPPTGTTGMNAWRPEATRVRLQSERFVTSGRGAEQGPPGGRRVVHLGHVVRAVDHHPPGGDGLGGGLQAALRHVVY